MNKIDLAIQIASRAFLDKVDSGNTPLILRSLSIGMMGKTDDEKTTGFLCGTLSKGRISPEELIQQGIPESIVKALQLLCPKEKNNPENIVDSIIHSGNPIALQVERNVLMYELQQFPDHMQLKSALQEIEIAIAEASHVGPYEFRSILGTAVFAGGCFWGVQHEFEKETGVLRTLVGYTGGEEKDPTYALVRNHETHHVEAVIVEFDPDQITYKRLCQIFFEMHDPSQADGVGPDIGPQYLSEIFYLSGAQRRDAEAVMEDLRSRGYVVKTKLRPAETFWVGEEYHQHYYEKTGGEPYCHIREKKFS